MGFVFLLNPFSLAKVDNLISSKFFIEGGIVTLRQIQIGQSIKGGKAHQFWINKYSKAYIKFFRCCLVVVGKFWEENRSADGGRRTLLPYHPLIKTGSCIYSERICSNAPEHLLRSWGHSVVSLERLFPRLLSYKSWQFWIKLKEVAIKVGH